MGRPHANNGSTLAAALSKGERAEFIMRDPLAPLRERFAARLNAIRTPAQTTLF